MRVPRESFQSAADSIERLFSFRQRIAACRVNSAAIETQDTWRYDVTAGHDCAR